MYKSICMQLTSTKNKTETKGCKRYSAVGIRLPENIREIVNKIAAEEKRSLPNVLVYIVDQYLSSTNGRLLRNIKIVDAGLKS